MLGLPLLLFLLLIVTAGVTLIWWQERRLLKKAIAVASQTITNSQVTVIESSTIKSRWVDAVVGFDGLELFLPGHNLILYGAESAGRPMLMARAVDFINSRFSSTRHAAIYIDMRGMISLANPQPWLSVDVLYHHLLVTPLMWYRGLSKQDSVTRRQRRLEARLETLLGRPQNEINMMDVRVTFENWLGTLGIQKLSLFLDYFSELPPDLAPQLLYLLTRTHPRGSRLAFTLGGTHNQLVIERLKDGRRIGLQINHDVRVVFDLDEILQSRDIHPSRADPRQIFLLDCLASLAPEYANFVDASSQLDWEAIFNPSEAWFDLFQVSEFNIEQVGAALADLLPDVAGNARRRITRTMIEKAVRRVETRAQLH